MSDSFLFLIVQSPPLQNLKYLVQNLEPAFQHYHCETKKHSLQNLNENCDISILAEPMEANSESTMATLLCRKPFLYK